MHSTFKIGDVVMLKSGGPRMTVSGPALDDGDFPCIWFDFADKKFDTFHPEMLALIDQPGSMPPPGIAG